jgi:hypothetical protein
VAGTIKKYKKPIMVKPIKQASIAHNKLVQNTGYLFTDPDMIHNKTVNITSVMETSRLMPLYKLSQLRIDP